MNNKNISLNVVSAILFAVLLIGIPSVFAQGSASSQQGLVIVDPVQSKYLGPVDKKTSDIAEKYIKQKLGNDYYGKYINFEFGDSYEDCVKNKCVVRNEVLFKYDMPFDASEDPKFGGNPKIIVSLNSNGEIIKYLGPKKPYQFIISEVEAIKFAKDYGIISFVDAGIVTSHDDEEGYEVVWAISSNDIASYGEVLNEPLYRGVYIDVDTGEVLGEYNINPMIGQVPGGSSANLGQFFDKNEVRKNESASTSGSLWIVVLIVLVVLVVVFVGYKFVKR